jgi:hypothetical protein
MRRQACGQPSERRIRAVAGEQHRGQADALSPEPAGCIADRNTPDAGNLARLHRDCVMLTIGHEPAHLFEHGEGELVRPGKEVTTTASGSLPSSRKRMRLRLTCPECQL